VPADDADTTAAWRCACRAPGCGRRGARAAAVRRRT